MFRLLRRKNRNRGFTLLESIISVLILGLTVGAMVGVLMIGRAAVTKGKDYIGAMNLVRERMEWIKAQSYASLPRGAAAVTATYPYLTETETVIIDYGRDIDGDGDFDDEGEEDELTGTRITQIQPVNDSDGSEMYLRVTVTVTWTERFAGGTTWNASESLVTYVSE